MDNQRNLDRFGKKSDLVTGQDELSLLRSQYRLSRLEKEGPT